MVYLIGNYSLILRVLRRTQDAHIQSFTRAGVIGGSLGSFPVLRGEAEDAKEASSSSSSSAPLDNSEDRGSRPGDQDTLRSRILDIGQDSGEAQVFGENLAQQIGLYVEYEVQEKFGKLVRFVLEHSQETREDGEAAGAQAESPPKVEQIPESAFDAVVHQFSRSDPPVRTNHIALKLRIGVHFFFFFFLTLFSFFVNCREWRSGMSNMHDSVMQDFSNLVEEGASEEDRESQKDMAREILKRSMIQLVLYYQRFQNLVQKWRQRPGAAGNPRFLKDVVSIQAIKAEIKKYGRQ